MTVPEKCVECKDSWIEQDETAMWEVICVPCGRFVGGGYLDATYLQDVTPPDWCPRRSE